jgi:hypothetical protein
VREYMDDVEMQRAVAAEFSEHLRGTTHGRATITSTYLDQHRLTIIDVNPHTPGALAMEIIAAQFFIIALGSNASWEYDYRPESLQRVREIIHAVVSGKGRVWPEGGVELDLPSGKFDSRWTPERWLWRVKGFVLGPRAAQPRAFAPY